MRKQVWQQVEDPDVGPSGVEAQEVQMGPTRDIHEVAKQGKGTQAKEVRATEEEVLAPQVHSIDSLMVDILELTFHLVQSHSLVGQYQQSYVAHLRYKVERDRYR